jgi:Cofactor assembly of complex C subunit B
MDNPILPSTLLLTLLLFVGLFFFIRAATKDRTEVAQLMSDQDEAALMPKLKEYFQKRSYQVTGLNREQNQVIFEGFVRPSGFLAVFLTLLAATGSLCLSLVLSFVFPSYSAVSLGVILLSPIVGVFYWKKAGRFEKVSLKLESSLSGDKSSSRITVTAHRDELLELRRSLELKQI